MNLNNLPCLARPFLAVVFAHFLVACSMVPASSSGTSRSEFRVAADIPKQVNIVSGGIDNHDPVGQILMSELPRLGFIIVDESAPATFYATVRTSDFSPVVLDIALTEAATETILWRAEIVRKWDVYASIVSASQDNAREAIVLLRRDLSKVPQ